MRPPKVLTRPLAALAGGLLVVICYQASASPTVPIIVKWQGTQPSTVALGGVIPPKTLELNEDHSAYQLDYEPNVERVYLSSVSLDAAYGDGSVVSIPIRVWPQLRGVSATLYQISYTSCSPQDLLSAERPAGTILGALKSYFVARALYLLTGDDKCSLSNQRAAAQAWFDRAYELTTLAPYFDLSPDAAAAYSYYDPDYVRKYTNQVRAAALKIVNVEKDRALDSGDIVLAASLSTSLLRIYASDPEVAALGGTLQHLPLSFLRNEDSVIQARMTALHQAQPSADQTVHTDEALELQLGGSRPPCC